MSANVNSLIVLMCRQETAHSLKS